MTRKTRERIFRGDRMVSAREAMGLKKPQQLAEMIDIDERQIRRYESGEAEPTGAIISVLSETLNVSTDWLYGLTDDPARRGSNAEGAKTPSERRLLEAYRSGDLRELMRIAAEQNAPQPRQPSGAVKGKPSVK